MPGLDRLPVAVSEAELHDIEAPGAFETAGSFLVAVTNHGRDAHVYLELDDDLAAAARLSETNVYVERDATREVEVSVDPDAGHVAGELLVETGYGAESESVSVTVGTPDGPEVPVDEDLGEPPAGDPSRGGEDQGEEETTARASTPARSGPILEQGWVPVAVLAAVALALAGATAVLVSDPVVIAGVVAVLAGVVAAGAILLRY